MIYADNAATTRISNIAYEKMLPFLKEQYGNASSQCSLGVNSKRAIEQSRQQVATAMGAETAEIVFTSGGSETNSWVLHGIADLFEGKSAHIITSSIEHYSILEACHVLETKGVEITCLPVNANGEIEIKHLKAAIRPNTKLVSIMLANNEIGTIQPINEIGQYLRDRDILFHTDAVQAVGHIPLNVNDLCVDFLSASAHKFNGPKGIGFLFKRSYLLLPKLVFGGNQELGKRAGTENVAGIVAAGYALEESVALMNETTNKLSKIVDITVKNICKCIPHVKVNGHDMKRLPGMVNLRFGDVSGESLMHLLDLKGICISTSSACTAGKDDPSHVLLALGLSEQQAKSSIRISYGRYNTINDANKIVSTICEVYDKIKMI